MIIIILAVALILRLVLINQSLWLDEAINVNNAATLSFHDLLLNYSLADFHPPLYHAILKIWILFAGQSEIAVRIPSVIFGVATVYVTYLLAKKLYEEKTALIAATLMATAPLAIYYSQEARMYAAAAAAASLSVYFFISILKSDKLQNWIGFIASTTIMLYLDYLPYLLLPAYFVYLFTNDRLVKKHTLHAFLPAAIIIAFFLTPWLVLFPQQIQNGLSAAAISPAWAQVVGSPQITTLAVTFVKFTIGRISHDNNLIYALMFSPAAAYIAFLFGMSHFRISRLRSFLWYFLFLTVILGFGLSFFVPVFSYFRFLFVLPAFYIIIASAINTINWPPLVRTLLGLFLIINLTSTYIYFSNPKFQREDWKGASSYVLANSNENSIALFESNFTMAPFDYYNQGQVQAEGGLDNFNPQTGEVRLKLEGQTKDKDKVFLFQYLSQITDPQGIIFKELSLQGFTNTQTKDFPGVGFLYQFEK